jgi:hypothetical protein
MFACPIDFENLHVEKWRIFNAVSVNLAATVAVEAPHVANSRL